MCISGEMQDRLQSSSSLISALNGTVRQQEEGVEGRVVEK